MTREEIRKWPDGVFKFTDFIDDDGFSDTPLPISSIYSQFMVTVTVDYDGTASQVPAALNSTRSHTNSCTYLSVRCVLKGDIPNNAGVFRAINVKAPEASIVNPKLPAACAARALTGYRIVDAMFGALSQVVPGSCACSGGRG